MVRTTGQRCRISSSPSIVPIAENVPLLLEALIRSRFFSEKEDSLSKPIVLVTPPPIYNSNGYFLEVLRAAGLEVRFPTPGGRKLQRDELIPNLVDVSAVLTGPEVYSREILEAHPKLRVLARCGVGYDNFDIDAATDLNIAVGFAPGANHEAVGEHALMLMLAASRELLARDKIVRNGQFDRTPVLPLRGRTLGIIGLGRTGRATLQRTLAFGMSVVAVEPFPNWDLIDPKSVRLMSLDELLPIVDYVSIHCPLNSQTYGMFNADALAKMKPNSILINTARGGIVDEAALAEALSANKIGAAGIDVFEHEPPIGSPLLQAPRTVLTPHIAGIDVESIDRMARFAAEVIADLYASRWPVERMLNADRLQNWKW